MAAVRGDNTERVAEVLATVVALSGALRRRRREAGAARSFDTVCGLVVCS